MTTRPYLGPSDAQANAEAVARRDRAYAAEHATEVRSRFPKGFTGMLTWFLRAWESPLPNRMHGRGEEWDTPGRITRGDGSGVTDPGGGNGLGAPRWDPRARAYLFGPVRAVDEDGGYVWKMHVAVDNMSGRHPLKAALLRMIGRGGDWHMVRVTCSGCSSSVTLPDEYAEAIARDALRVAFTYYQDAPRSTKRIP